MIDLSGVVDGLGVKVSTALAGLAGGVARVVFIGQSSPLSWKRALGLIMLGAISAGYITPLIGLAIALPPEGPLERGIGFLVGLASMGMIEGLLRLIDWLREDPGRLVDIIRRRPPPGGAS